MAGLISFFVYWFYVLVLALGAVFSLLWFFIPNKTPPPSTYTQQRVNAFCGIALFASLFLLLFF